MVPELSEEMEFMIAKEAQLIYPVEAGKDSDALAEAYIKGVKAVIADPARYGLQPA